MSALRRGRSAGRGRHRTPTKLRGSIPAERLHALRFPDQKDFSPAERSLHHLDGRFPLDAPSVGELDLHLVQVGAVGELAGKGPRPPG